MIFVSEIIHEPPSRFNTPLHEKVYKTLQDLNIPFARVDTSVAITMEDCIGIEQKLAIGIVKTLCLCNRQQTTFYLFITAANKSFSTKDFSSRLGISRVSFAPEHLFKEVLGTEIGAATVFSVLQDNEGQVNLVFDEEIIDREWYGCSDGTTTGYMKVKTTHILNELLSFTGHKHQVIKM